MHMYRKYKKEGDMSLYDYGLGTLSQYGLNAERSARTRGALLCYTEQGILILREFHGSEKKAEKTAGAFASPSGKLA